MPLRRFTPWKKDVKVIKELCYKAVAILFALCFVVLSAGDLCALAVCGDADGDGIVTAADGRLVFDYASGKDVDISYTGKKEADVDGDGTLTVGDAAQILRYVSGAEAKLPTNAVLRLQVLSLPHKTMYLPGEPFDIGGFRIGALYSDGVLRPISSYTYSGYTDIPGTKIITVDARGKKLSFTVQVDDPVPVRLEIASYPTKRLYSVGSLLSTSGLVLKAVYADGSRAALNGYSVSGYDGEPGIHTIKLMYMGVSTEYTVGCGYSAIINGGGSRLNVRSDSNGSASVVGTFNEGDAVVVIEPDGQNGWCYCWGKSSSGAYISGWCYKQYLIISA